jgi:sterol desaturase/sphingolipid hydroxylase (fatty acid hydroxylase superfamily)
MRQFFNRLWNYDFAHSSPTVLKYLFYFSFSFLLVFGVYDLLFDTGSGYYHFLIGKIAKAENLLEYQMDFNSFKTIVYASFALLAIYISVFAVVSFNASVKLYGKERFTKIFFVHLASNGIAMLASLLFFSFLGMLALLLGFSYDHGSSFIQHNLSRLENFIQNYVPTIQELPMPLAIVFGTILGSLPGYFSHWLAHKSRLVWLAAHRCHHTAEIMHASGTGPFMFLPEVFVNLPTIFISAVCTKLFYHEPLLLEVTVVAFVGILTEKFNHTTAFYDFAYRNFLVRWVSAYYGNGVYHYMHHTAKEGDEIINIGGSPFLVWDRIFGTYRTPSAQKPKVGLTNTPPIRLNPLAIVFSGITQIAYELKMNKSWITRIKILFGDVYYVPPITKEFLKLEGEH